MNCGKAKDLLQAYLDGTLEPTGRLAVEGHVAGCPGCRGELVQLERLLLAIESLPRFSAPERVVARTMAAIAPRFRPTPRSRLVGWAINGGGLMAVLTGLIVVLTSAGEAGEALAGLTLDQDNPFALIDSLLAVAASMELTFVAGMALLLSAGYLTLVQLVTTPGTEMRTS